MDDFEPRPKARRLSMQAAAAYCAAFCEITRADDLARAAIAAAAPYRSFSVTWRTSQHDKSTEPTAGQIN